MKAIPLLEPVFQGWERFSDANPGIGFMTFIYGAVLLLVWMFSRFQPSRIEPHHAFILAIRKPVEPPWPPVIRREYDPLPSEDDDDDSDSFAE